MSECAQALMARKDIHPGIHPFLHYEIEFNTPEAMEKRREEALKFQEQNTDRLVELYKQQLAKKQAPEWSIVAPSWVLRLLSKVGIIQQLPPRWEAIFGGK